MKKFNVSALIAKPKVKTALKFGSFGLGLCLLSLISGCASDSGAKRTNDSRPIHRQTQIDQREDTFGDAVSAPLEDLNLRRAEIPELLIYAIKHTYELRGLDSCEAIAAEVSRLNALLGEDFDEPPPPADDRSLTDKGKDEAGKAAVGAVRSASRGLIPFRGIVRQISGADKHEKEVARAVKAGNQRRAFLKGIGMNRNCAPPAAPSWFVPRTKVPKNDVRKGTSTARPYRRNQ